MICKNCGFEIKENEKFCMNCGAALCRTENIITESDLADASIEYEKSKNIQNEESDKADEEQNYHNQNDDIVLTNYEIDKKYEAAFKLRCIRTFIISTAVLLVLAMIITAFAFLKDVTATKELEKAIESKNASSVNAIYDEARGNTSKIKKYDAVIGKLIDDMIADINSYNFDDDALVNASGALDNYVQKQWGALVNLHQIDDINPSISNENSEKYKQLTDLMRSKYHYCGGLYEYKTDNEYIEALSFFACVNEIDSKFEDVKTMIGECTDLYINEVLAAVEEKVSEDDVSGGLDLLNNAKERLDSIGVSSEEISNKINETIAAYAEKYAAKAEEAFKQKDVDAAIGNIEVALELQPDNADYKIKYDTYQQYYPYYLYLEDNILFTENHDRECNSFSGNVDRSFHKSGTANDNSEITNSIYFFHNIYNPAKNIYDIEYNLSGNYDIVSGKLYIDKTYKNDDQIIYFEAYGDGKLVYTSPKLGKGDLPQDIFFKVTGVQKLKIKFYAGTDDSLWGSAFGISNLTAQKAFPEQ